MKIKNDGELTIKTVEKKAEKGDFIIISSRESDVEFGRIFEVEQVFSLGVDIRGSNIYVFHREYNVLVPTMTVDLIDIEEDKQVAYIPANLSRIDVINAARKFVHNTLETTKDYHPTKTEANAVYNDWVTEVEFIVNEEKRTVVALARGAKSQGKGRIYGRGFAKCMEDDVFNEDIGKAIALVKLYGFPQEQYDRFYDAVQPEEFEVGMVVGPNRLNNATREVVWEPFTIDSINGEELTDHDDTYIDREYAKIISDSNVKYDGLETYV